MSYSDKVLDHYNKPRNVGSLDKKDPNVGTGLVGAPECLHGDTLIALADGRKFVTIKQLAEECKDIPIYAWDDNIKEYVVAWGLSPRLIRKNVQTIKIEFDDGSYIICTPDHQFLKYSLNGRGERIWLRGDELSINDSLTPFVRRLDQGYYRIYHGHNYSREHIMIMKFLGHDTNGMHVHHKNEITTDNTWSNLETKTSSDHHGHHMVGDKNPMRRFPESNHFKLGFKGSKNGRWIKIDNEFLIQETRNILGLDINFSQYKKIAKEKGWPQNLDARFGSFQKFKELVQDYNHKISCISIVGLSDVYCLTVPKYNCFATVLNHDNKNHSGVLVHNCGDVMRLQIRVEGDRIVDAKFKTFGCGSALASSSLATEWIKGKTLDEAEKITNTHIVEELSLPPVKIHCSVLAEDAIKSAIQDYKNKQK